MCRFRGGPWGSGSGFGMGRGRELRSFFCLFLSFSFFLCRGVCMVVYGWGYPGPVGKWWVGGCYGWTGIGWRLIVRLPT